MEFNVYSHEQERLFILQTSRLLDTPASENFDRITRLARKFFDVPIALISLLDADRQWFKSAVGLEARETSRHIAFCDHTIRRKEVFVVENAHTHPDFHDNPLVTGDPNIAFYAGAPLITNSGHALGSLCVIDTRPRRFTADDHSLLQDMARIVMTEIELHRGLGRVDEATNLPNNKQLTDDLKDLSVLYPGARRTLVVFRLMDTAERLSTITALGQEVIEEIFFHAGMRISKLLQSKSDLYHLGSGHFATHFALAEPAATGEHIEDLLLLLRHPFEIGRLPLEFRPKVGVVDFTLLDSDLRDAPRKALSALLSEAAEHSPVVFHDPEVDLSHQFSHRLLRDIGAGLKAGHFRLVYQPKFDIKLGVFTGAEALLRWRHPEFGDISPAQFIPLAENTYLMHEVTEWVLNNAFRQVALWQSNEFFLNISVNVTARNLERDDFPELLRNIALRENILSEQVQIECTESMALDSDAALANLAAIRARGFSVALDDFGSGYSNLASLATIPADVIKIDRSIVKDIAKNARSSELFKALVNLGKSWNYSIVAEGVETVDVFDVVKEAGCHAVQGYYFSKPLEASALPNFVRAFSRVEESGT